MPESEDPLVIKMIKWRSSPSRSRVNLAGIRWKRKDPAAAHGFGDGGSDEKAVMVEERAMAKEVR
ncbi:uncharacterized protein DS421_3g83820 [Arachis hypogaea]|nr:uncharacterized protein DS421_3g83820 [Arachis hypogaea]